jgi:hypothetical protein
MNYQVRKASDVPAEAKGLFRFVNGAPVVPPGRLFPIEAYCILLDLRSDEATVVVEALREANLLPANLEKRFKAANETFPQSDQVSFLGEAING